MSVKNLIGIIPGAGQGSRLAPFPCPKELFPIGYQDYTVSGIVHRRPKVISQYLLENMISAGVNKFLFVISEGKSDIMKYYGDGSRFNTLISYLYQEKPNGMATAINLANPWVEDTTVLFGMPDTIIEPENVFKILLQSHEQNNNSLTLGLFKTDTPTKFGMVDISADGSILSTIDKPKETHLTYMWGCCCWEPSFTKLISQYLEINNGLMNEIVIGDIFNQALLLKMKVGGVIFDEGQYMDIGTSDELDKALKKFHL